MNLSLQERESLRQALSDPYVKSGLRVFAFVQASYYTQNVLAEVRKSQPDSLKAAQEAGKLDAYEHFLNELEHFIQNSSDPLTE